jgi:hypothetical protein
MFGSKSDDFLVRLDWVNYGLLQLRSQNSTVMPPKSNRSTLIDVLCAYVLGGGKLDGRNARLKGRGGEGRK